LECFYNGVILRPEGLPDLARSRMKHMGLRRISIREVRDAAPDDFPLDLGEPNRDLGPTTRVGRRQGALHIGILVEESIRQRNLVSAVYLRNATSYWLV
jgi:hypothetical protein